MDDDKLSSDSSIDAKHDGTIDQRADYDCFCSHPDYVRQAKKKLLAKELQCSFCLSIFVKPVTLSCGHSYCKFCVLNYFLKNNLDCGICRNDVIISHPLELKVNIAMDSICRQLNAKDY